MSERIFTTYQVANLLGATPGAVVDWVNRGWLESSQLDGGRMLISSAALEDFLSQRGIDLAALLEKLEGPSANQPQSQANHAEAVAEQITEAVIAKAVAGGATQIHFILDKGKLHLRLRIEGVMHDRQGFAEKLPQYLAVPILRHLLKLAADKKQNLDTPASGDFEFIHQNEPVKIDIFAMPQTDGYLAVLHINPPAYTLQRLPLPAADIEWLDETLAISTGLVLVCGPNSARLEAAKALYGHVKSDDKFCVSVGRGGFDFSPEPARQMGWANISGTLEKLKPSVILAADLRDPLSAYSLFELACGDSLVIAAINSPSPSEAVCELFEMGIEPWALAKKLLCVVANSKLIKVDNNLADVLKTRPSKETLGELFDSIES